MAEPLPTVLLVDDEPHALSSMRMALEDEFDCLTAPDADAAMALMEEHFVRVIFCDQRMPGKTGVAFLSEVRERWPDVVRIIITGYTESSDMISAINEAGIWQFITKPWHPEQLLLTARNAAELFRLARDHDRMSLEMRHLPRSVESRLDEQRRALREGLGFEKILRAPNSPMNAVIEQARQFASFDVPVLISGEPATGKAELARAIHFSSLRADRPFYAVNCLSVDDDILEMELFGARRGEAPGIQSAKTGLVQKAARGTLYLGGVNDLSPRMQRALARLATTGEFRARGGHEMQRADIRIISGADEDLRAAVAAGRFRADLWYALAKTSFTIPPLRSRPDDIPILAHRMLMDASAEHGKLVHGLSREAERFLGRYDWPGNLKELENEITRMLIFAMEPEPGPELISRHILQAAPPQGAENRGGDGAIEPLLEAGGTLRDRVQEVETRILRETLTRLRWNKSRAAEELGLSRVSLRAKIDRYGLAEPPRKKSLQGAREKE